MIYNNWHNPIRGMRWGIRGKRETKSQLLESYIRLSKGEDECNIPETCTECELKDSCTFLKLYNKEED